MNIKMYVDNFEISKFSEKEIRLDLNCTDIGDLIAEVVSKVSDKEILDCFDNETLEAYLEEVKLLQP